MAEFKKLVMTTNGQTLMAKIIAGTAGAIEFTKICLSDTTYTDEQLEALTALSNIKQTMLISKVIRTNDVAIQIEGATDNEDLTTGYYMRAIGLYAIDPQNGEILYAVANTNVAGYMPPYNGITVSGGYFKLVTTVGNASNVSLEVDPAAVATIGDIQTLQTFVATMDTTLQEVVDKLTATRSVTVTGDVTGTTTFNGESNVSIATTAKDSGVSAGTYKSVTVDTKGRVTNGTNPTTLIQYGISDAVPITRTVNNKPLSTDIVLTGTDIAITDTGGYYTATTVEGATQEIGGKLATANGNISTLQTDVTGIKAEIETPDQNTVSLTELEQVKSVTDSYGGIAEFTVGGATLYQAIVNGNVANGIYGWISGSSTVSVLSKIMSVAGDGTSNLMQVTHYALGKLKLNDKIFVSARVRITDSYLPSVTLRLSDGVTSYNVSKTLLAENVWYDISSIFTITSATPTSFSIVLRNGYVDAATANGKVMEIDGNTGVFAIPITGTPYENYTADQMNAMVNEYWEGLKSAQRVDVLSRGRNLFDVNKLITVTGVETKILSENSFSMKAIGGVNANITPIFSSIKFKENTSYTISGYYSQSGTGNPRLAIMYTDGTIAVLFTTSTARTFFAFSTSSSKTILNFGYTFSSLSDSVATYDTLMLNEGTTALPYEPYQSSKVTINCTDITKFDRPQIPNLVQNTVGFKDGKWWAGKRVERLSMASGVVINTTNLTGAKSGGSYYLAQSDGVISIGLVDGTYTTTATATVYYELATPIVIPQESFSDYGIEVTGTLSSNNDYTEFYADSYDIFSPISIDYATNIAKAVDNLKDGVINLKEFQTLQNLINLEFDARLTALEP